MRMYTRFAVGAVVAAGLFGLAQFVVSAGLLQPEKQAELKHSFCKTYCSHIQTNRTFSVEEFNACMTRCL